MEVLYLHHTVVSLFPGKKATRAQEEAYWRTIRRIHMDRGYDDIAYCFGVCPSGRIYELIGYGRGGIHTCHHNDQLAIVYAGNCETTRPTEEALEAISWFIAESRKNKHLRSNSETRGHRDVGACSGPTACPGKHLYDRLPIIRAKVKDYEPFFHIQWHGGPGNRLHHRVTHARRHSHRHRHDRLGE